MKREDEKRQEKREKTREDKEQDEEKTVRGGIYPVIEKMYTPYNSAGRGFYQQVKDYNIYIPDGPDPRIEKLDLSNPRFESGTYAATGNRLHRLYRRLFEILS